jgi:hypothetical protein
MAILWCGGEDLDFPNSVAPTVSTTAAQFRAGYARCNVTPPVVNTMIKSMVFPGGAVTSAWVTFRAYITSVGARNSLAFGFGLSGTAKGLFIGSDSASFQKTALSKYDGTTITQLASEAGTSIPTASVHRWDIQLTNYGASATVNVYLDGALLINFSGDVTVSGVTNVDSIFIGLQANSSTTWASSEIIVADEDTRSFPGLVTMAPNGAGTTTNWTNNAFTNLNGTTISDAQPVSSNTNAQLQEYNLIDLPTGTFVIKAVMIAARMAKSQAPGVTQVELGYNSGGSVAYGTGATKALTTGYTTYNQLDSINPVTGVAWVQSDMNGLQIDMQALT